VKDCKAVLGGVVRAFFSTIPAGIPDAYFSETVGHPLETAVQIERFL
jgi:hypothetical protein